MEQSEADEVRGRIKGTLDYDDFADCDLVIEAITENLDAKLEMWRELDADREAGGALRHQHLVARRDRPGRRRPSARSTSSAFTSSTRRR